MKKIYNSQHNKELRSYLRHNPTKNEEKLWEYLRNRKFHGYKFHRQYGIYRYIVDFYCPSLKLVIEVDGNQHYTKDGLEYDRIRDKYIESLGLDILRFRNEEVLENTEEVLSILLSFLKERRKEEKS